MKDLSKKLTRELPGIAPRRGRPVTGKAKTDAQRMVEYRKRKAGINVTVTKIGGGMTPTLEDLKARVDAVKNANLLQKSALADHALAGLLQYLAEQDARIKELENNQAMKITYKREEHGGN